MSNMQNIQWAKDIVEKFNTVSRVLPLNSLETTMYEIMKEEWRNLSRNTSGFTRNSPMKAIFSGSSSRYLFLCSTKVTFYMKFGTLYMEVINSTTKYQKVLEGYTQILVTLEELVAID